MSCGSKPDGLRMDMLTLLLRLRRRCLLLPLLLLPGELAVAFATCVPRDLIVSCSLGCRAQVQPAGSGAERG